MSIPKAGKSRAAQSADNSRRAFIWKMGAGVSTVLAPMAVMAKEGTGGAPDPAQRAALLEEEAALRRLHRNFEHALDKGVHDDVIGMFADDAQVRINGGVFNQRSQGVSRLYRDIFPSGKAGARMEPAPGFELSTDQQRDSVAVSWDRKSAQAVFPYSIRMGAPIETESSLAAMARLHGEGVQSWWEGGLYRLTYRKDADGHWKILRLDYDTLSRADYRAGRSYAQPITVPRFAALFPSDQAGPDELV